MAETLFYVAGFGLVLSGLLTLGFLFSTPLDPNAIVPMVLIGLLELAYLVIGAMLLMRRDSALMPGIIAPVIGIMISIPRWFPWMWINFGPGIMAGFTGAEVQSVTQPSETVWFIPVRRVPIQELQLPMI